MPALPSARHAHTPTRARTSRAPATHRRRGPPRRKRQLPLPEVHVAFTPRSDFRDGVNSCDACMHGHDSSSRYLRPDRGRKIHDGTGLLRMLHTGQLNCTELSSNCHRIVSELSSNSHRTAIELSPNSHMVVIEMLHTHTFSLSPSGLKRSSGFSKRRAGPSPNPSGLGGRGGGRRRALLATGLEFDMPWGPPHPIIKTVNAPSSPRPPT